MIPFSEHRRAPRVNVDLPVLRKVEQRFVPEKALNLSATGMALETHAPLTPGTVENLVLSSRDGTVEVSLQAEVVRVQAATERAQYIAGLRFASLDISSTSRIEALMLSAMRTPSGTRSGPRVEVHADAFWSGPGASGAAPLEMVNFSQHGAMIRGETLPPPDARGLISVRHEESGEMLTMPAQVVWLKDDHGERVAGLKFDAHQSTTDVVSQMVRAFLFVPRPSLPSAEVGPGLRIGGFELGPLWARGRVLEVYRARALNPSQETAGASTVALKRFSGDVTDVEAWTQRFLAAAELGRHLHEHPGVARVFSAMGDTRECWLATELVRGSSLEEGLAELVRKGQSVPLDAVLSVVREVLATLDDCHRFILTRDGNHLDVLHGDLRPNNILIDAAGNVKLTGFGSPFRLTPESVPWLPPEVLGGHEPTPQSDVYQVGVLLYESLTGVLPFRADTPEKLAGAIGVGAVPPSRLNHDVPEALDRVVLCALAADPDNRPPGCAAFAEELLQLELSPEVMSAARRRLALVKTREITRDQPIEPALPEVMPSPPRRSQPLSPWSPTRSALAQGEVVGRYTILGKLAEGGMAEVFLARGPNDRPLVLKTVFTGQDEEREVVTRFLNEARLASIISHTNVAQIHDVGFDRGRPFIAMEYVEGRNLHDLLLALEAGNLRLAPQLAAAIVAECCAGLDHAHALRVVHRDVTARNILISYRGEVKLVDFGIARAGGVRGTTKPGKVRGTSGYLAPEQLGTHPVTGTADVWALGVNLYRMLTGAMPFQGKTDFQVFSAILDLEPQPVRELNPDAPPALAAVAQRALVKKTADRYKSAMAMRNDVEALVEAHHQPLAELGRLMETLFPEGDPERARLAAYAMPNSRAASVK